MEENIKLNTLANGNDLVTALNSDNFVKLTEKNQTLLLNQLNHAREKEAGLMGKFFGTKKENASIHIAFTVCILLTIIGVICMYLGNNYWNVIIPGIMTAVGYIFGKGDK